MKGRSRIECCSGYIETSSMDAPGRTEFRSNNILISIFASALMLLTLLGTPHSVKAEGILTVADINSSCMTCPKRSVPNNPTNRISPTLTTKHCQPCVVSRSRSRRKNRGRPAPRTPTIRIASSRTKPIWRYGPTRGRLALPGRSRSKPGRNRWRSSSNWPTPITLWTHCVSSCRKAPLRHRPLRARRKFRQECPSAQALRSKQPTSERRFV